MKRATWLGALLFLGLTTATAQAGRPLASWEASRINRRLHGQVVDYTKNHGADRRIWSEVLQCKRDLYVYLPPCYDPARRYPLMLYLHTFRDDELSFFGDGVVEYLDNAIVNGKLPPMIVACVDGSIHGHRTYLRAGSFYINSDAGRFEDHVLEVWNLLVQTYPVRPEREAHVLLGASMGGFAAFNLAIKYRETFKVAIGLFPPLNLLYVDCHDRYRKNFDPCCWSWRSELRPHEIVARFFGIPVRMRQLTDQVFDRSTDVIGRISAENPIEMLDRYDVRPGELDLYIAYAGKDQFNIDAQVENFLYVAKQRGLEVGVGYAPHGRHGPLTARNLFPGVTEWLGAHLTAYFCPLE